MACKMGFSGRTPCFAIFPSNRDRAGPRGDAALRRLRGDGRRTDRQVRRNLEVDRPGLDEDEFAIINVDEKDGKPAASVVNIQKMMLGDANVEQVAIQGDSLVIAQA